MKSLLVSFILLTVSLNLYARDLTMQQKTSDIVELAAMVKGGYGPLEYKKTNYGIDLNDLVLKYKDLVKNTKNNSEFYYLVVQFVAEFNDSHFGARIPTDHRSTLGFKTDLVNGKVLIESIDRKILTEEKFDFSKGDEIVSLDGKMITAVLKELLPYMGQGSKQTSLRKAATLVSSRFGSLVPVKDGKSVMTIRKGDSEFIEEVELEWNLSGNPLDEFIPSTTKNFFSFNHKTDYGQISLFKDESFENSFRCSGTTRTKIPKDATIIMEKPFVAYYHPTEKGNMGYLRIPHYSPKEKNPAVKAYDLRFSQYEYAVNELEKNTVGLIIDQDHNCGGSVSYLHRILSLFAKKPFAPVQFELLANKQSYIDFKGWMDETYKYTVDYQKGKLVVDMIKESWMKGTSFLTAKTSLSGRTKVMPNNISYTKPIIVLIDENSGSGGDAFPAMMQGIGRAKLLGTRTMGAGGHVIKLPPLTNSQINVRMTKSLFYHPNATAIENNGASPDINYTHTRDDFIYEYRGYQKFYLNELSKLIK